MHEHSIANKIIEDVKKNSDNVKSITIEVGDLAHLPAPEMKEVLENMTNWEINVTKKPATVFCDFCNYKGKPTILEQMHDNNIYQCPNCENMLPEIIDGGDIILKEIKEK